jgi:hypothetical protein
VLPISLVSLYYVKIFNEMNFNFLSIMNVIITLNIGGKMFIGNLTNVYDFLFIICRKFRRTEPLVQIYDDAIPGMCICIMY